MAFSRIGSLAINYLPFLGLRPVSRARAARHSTLSGPRLGTTTRKRSPPSGRTPEAAFMPGSRCQSGSTQGDLDTKDGAQSDAGRLCSNLAAVTPDDAASYGQTDPGTR